MGASDQPTYDQNGTRVMHTCTVCHQAFTYRSFHPHPYRDAHGVWQERRDVCVTCENAATPVDVNTVGAALARATREQA